MRTADFDFPLPAELVAQQPCADRDQSRLLVVHRGDWALEHSVFAHLPQFLHAGDVLVLNNSRVLPARLRGRNSRSGGLFEVLLIEEQSPNDWWALLRPAKRARLGTRIALCDASGMPTDIAAQVVDKGDGGRHRLHFEGTNDLHTELDALGQMPLPPYIRRHGLEPEMMDRERYQTVFSSVPGSVAAPTAGLHFTEGLLEAIRFHGVTVCFVTLHVGLGTFAPVRAAKVVDHQMHEEWFELTDATAHAISTARAEGHRVVAVGTTTLRVLESVAAAHDGRVTPMRGRTSLFIYPPYHFLVVDALVTNFHLPCTTLLMLASAFAAPGETHGRELLLSAYAEAVRGRYRFFSYGDAMLIL